MIEIKKNLHFKLCHSQIQVWKISLLTTELLKKSKAGQSLQ